MYKSKRVRKIKHQIGCKKDKIEQKTTTVMQKEGEYLPHRDLIFNYICEHVFISIKCNKNRCPRLHSQ